MSSVIGHIGARVASEQDRVLAQQELPSSDELIAGIGRKRRGAQRRRRAVAALSTALAIIFAVAFGARMRAASSVPVSVVTSNVRVPSLGVTRAEEASVPLVFDDGTRIVVLRGATAELREVRAHGAVIALHDGTVNVDVVHTAESRWDLAAGPFGIRVTGTKFDATWDSRAGHLTVAMSEGTVVVSGPCVNESLSAPYRKVFACDEPSAASPASVASVASPSADAKAPPPARSPIAPLRETAASLVADADRARLAGETARARQLYAAVRERFPGTDQAGKSAFLLGRMADASGSPAEAARWFEVATRERGGFAPEALGRLMELEQKRGNTERAHALAVEYLKTHPGGPYVAYATSIVDAHR